MFYEIEILYILRRHSTQPYGNEDQTFAFFPKMDFPLKYNTLAYLKLKTFQCKRKGRNRIMHASTTEMRLGLSQGMGDGVKI